MEEVGISNLQPPDKTTKNRMLVLTKTMVYAMGEPTGIGRISRDLSQSEVSLRSLDHSRAALLPFDPLPSRYLRVLLVVLIRIINLIHPLLIVPEGDSAETS